MNNKTVILLLSAALVVMAGCSNSPTGLGEALIKAAVPAEGYWSGKTSQQKSVSYAVRTSGTKVSGFSITIYVDESWGYGEVTYQPPDECVVTDKKFNIDYSFFKISGTFNGPVDCSGTFFCDDYVVYNSVTYYFDATGTWDASLATAMDLAKTSALPAPIVTTGQRGDCRVTIRAWLKDN